MPRREVIRPDYDPVIVTLDKGPEGIQREGQYGVDYQYTVNNDQAIMWLPKSGRDAIINSGARKGDSVEICKSQRSGYVATLVSDGHEPGMRPPVQPQALQRQAPPQAEPARVPGTVHPITQLLTACLCSAVDAMVEARKHAASKQLELDGPSWEDVRAIALSVYINKSKESR